MTTDFHTPIATGAAANAAIFNSPLSSLDTAVSDNRVYVLAHQAELAGSRGGYGSLGARLDAMVFSGGNIATITDGAASAGQKIVDVDSTTGFVAGAYVAYVLAGGALEYNLIDEVTSSTRLTMTTNIGTGGIADNTYIAMISPSEYQAATVINYSGVSMTLPNTISMIARDEYFPEAYGAAGDGVTDDTAAFDAMLTAVKARTGAKKKSALIRLKPGANYLITNSLDFTDIEDIVVDGQTMLTRITYADADATATDRVLFDCLGSCRLTFRNLTIYGDSTDIPAVAFSLGRSTDGSGEDSGQIVIERVYIGGYWSIAGIYNVSSELMHVKDFWMILGGPDTATTKYGIYCSGYNDESVGSEYATRSATASMASPWIEHFNIGCGSFTDTLFIPLTLRRSAGSITVRDGYCYTYDSQPAIKFVGNIDGVLLEGILVEGAPDKSIHFAAYSGAGTINAVTLYNVNFGPYANVGLYSDAGTTINRLYIRNCTGQKSDNTSNLTFAGAVNDSDIDSWWSQSTGVFTAANFYHSRLHVREHTLTISDALGSAIWSNATGGDHYYHVQSGLRVGTIGATGLAEINNILTASATWDPGSLNDGATATTPVALNGVTQAGEWFCMAHFSSLAGTAWQLSAYAVDGAVTVILTNRTGGTVDLASGTLHVVAWKITGA